MGRTVFVPPLLCPPLPRYLVLGVLALAVLPRPLAAQDEPTAKSRIVSVNLFKNGLAAVKREVLLTEPGMYRLDATPDAVHGTFWIESNTNVEAALRLRDVAIDATQLPAGSMQEIFAGKKVTVHLTGNKLAPVSGTVAKLTTPLALQPDRPEYYARPPAVVQFLIVKTAKGQVYIKQTEIATVETEDDGAKLTKRKPVLVLTVPKDAQKPAVFVSYLTHGVAWAPSYRVDISDPKQLNIEMAAVLRNEMADFADAEVSLISGFPSVEFANVSSPLQAETAWAKFFQELAHRSGPSQDILTQNVVSNTHNFVSPTPRFNLAATPEGEGVDLHFEQIGKRSLLKGEALSMVVGKAKADYERVVEWTVSGKRSKDEMWDVLHFKNPFKFPLTTAPAMIVENAKFNGQRTCYWTNAGEETNLRITRSLSVRTLCVEEEDKTKPPDRVAVGKRDYTRIHVKGELLLNNHRKQPVKMHIVYSIGGNISNAQGTPRITNREGTLTDINPVHDVLWILTLQPGEERKLAYSYSTLVDR